MLKYSVLMSLYINEKPEHLRQSIESMINQTIKPDEIVIVKDGPITKELEDVLEEFSTNYSDLFKIVPSEKNIGLGLALNLGLENCRNELVARMDTDDIHCLIDGKQLKLLKKMWNLLFLVLWLMSLLIILKKLFHQELYQLNTKKFMSFQREEVRLIILLLCLRRVKSWNAVVILT